MDIDFCYVNTEMLIGVKYVWRFIEIPDFLQQKMASYQL